MAKKAAAEEVYDPGLTPASDLKALHDRISKAAGGTVYFGSDTRLKVRQLPTGMRVIDDFLGGGFAYNRVTILFGEYSSGKTVIAMLALKAAQRDGLSCALIDAEKSWNPEWARQLGVDPDNLIVTQPSSGEEGFNQMLAFVRAKVGVIAVDSLTALRPKAEFEGDEDEVFFKQQMGAHARLIGRGLMDLEAENQGTCIIGINQLREKVGVVYGNPEVQPGGRGQHFVSWQEIRVSRGEWLKEGVGKDAPRIGYRLRLSLPKNKQGAPFQQCEVPFYFTGSFDEIAGLVEVCMTAGIILSKPPMYYIGEEKFFGRGKLLEAVKDRADLRQLLEQRLTELPEIDL